MRLFGTWDQAHGSLLATLARLQYRTLSFTLSTPAGGSPRLWPILTLQLFAIRR
jgi:hypothetical protein